MTKFRAAAMLVASSVLSACVSSTPVEEEKRTAPLRVTPADLSWGPGPASLPAGSTSVVLEGDPRAAGSLFTMRVRLPAGAAVAPHTHPANERVTVISGSLFLGFGERLDRARSTRLAAGSYYVNPPGVPHYLWTDEEAVLQLTGIGPWKLEYVNPADEPEH